MHPRMYAHSGSEHTLPEPSALELAHDWQSHPSGYDVACRLKRLGIPGAVKTMNFSACLRTSAELLDYCWLNVDIL